MARGMARREPSGDFPHLRDEPRRHRQAALFECPSLSTIPRSQKAADPNFLPTSPLAFSTFANEDTCASQRGLHARHLQISLTISFHGLLGCRRSRQGPFRLGPDRRRLEMLVQSVQIVNKICLLQNNEHW